jgi:hypothetical protein
MRHTISAAVPFDTTRLHSGGDPPVPETVALLH